MYFFREDITGFIDEATNGEPIYKISDNPVEPGFIDITTIENLHSFGLKADGVDYKKVRDFIKQIVTDTGGFTAQSDTVKNICCIHKIGTHSERHSFLGSQQAVIDYMKVYNYNTSICRDSRLFESEILLRNELPDNHKDLLDEVRDLVLNYKFFAVEGTDKLDQEGVLDYIMGKVGTTYDGVGLINKPWTPETMTLTNLCNKVYNIISEGDYYYTPTPGRDFIIL